MSTVISTPISSINRSGPIGIPHCSKRPVDLLGAHAGLKNLGGIEQVGKENPVDQKTRRILHHHRQLSDLPRERQRPVARFIGGLPANDHFDQFHPADRIEEVQANHACG